MRKIPAEYDDPLDKLCYDVVEEISPIFKKMQFTPNMITTLGLLCTFIMIYFINIKQYELSVVFFIFGYFFDCMDGFYARKYKMVSEFGDYYDHFADIIKMIYVGYLIVPYYITNNNYLPLIILGLLILTGNMKQSYQDQYYKIIKNNGVDESKSINFLEKMTGTVNDINILKCNLNWLKLLGWGTTHVYVAFLMSHIFKN